MEVAEKQKVADSVIATLEKEYGKGTLNRISDKLVVDHPCIATGIHELDFEVIQAGGIPRKRITEMIGPLSGGKTTLALQTIAQVQKEGDLAAFVDAEHALDLKWAERLGVDSKALFVNQPDYGEQAIDIIDKMVLSNAFGVIVVDSVAALIPKAELDGDPGDAHMGLQARMMSSAMRRLTGAVGRSDTALIFINQIREKIGVSYGSNETTPGGRALPFFASLRLDIRRIGALKQGEAVIGNKVRIKAIKNKLGSPFREAEVDFVFGKGFDATGNLLDAGVLLKIVDKAGAWFSYKGERLGQGRLAAIEYLVNNPEILIDIQQKIKKASS